MRRRNERYRDIDDGEIRIGSVVGAEEAFSSSDAESFEPGRACDAETPDWGDDADISAFDS